MTKSLLISRKTKEKLFLKKLRVPSFTNLQKFKDYNKIYSKTCKKAKNFYFQKKFEEAGNNMKKGWETIREALESPKKANTLPGFFYKGGKKIRGDLNIAEGFNDFFANIGVKLDNLLPHGVDQAR